MTKPAKLTAVEDTCAACGKPADPRFFYHHLPMCDGCCPGPGFEGCDIRAVDSAIIDRLRADLAKSERLRAEIEKQFVDNCAIVQDYIQAEELGLGGENIFRLIVKYAREVSGQLDEARTDLSALLDALPRCQADFGCSKVATKLDYFAHAFCDEHCGLGVKGAALTPIGDLPYAALIRRLRPAEREGKR